MRPDKSDRHGWCAAQFQHVCQRAHGACADGSDRAEQHRVNSLLAQLTVDAKHPYDVTAEQAKGAELRLYRPLSALAPRLALLQKEVLGSNVRVNVAADFFSIEAWTRRGLQRFMVLFVIELSTRKVDIAGIASIANSLWMNQIGCNLTDAVNSILKGKRYLIHDRDPLYTAEFLKMVEQTGIASVKLPARSPNLNAYAERFVRTIKESCMERLILFGEDSVRRTAKEFTAHYLAERNHQGLDNRLICPDPSCSAPTGFPVTCM